MMKKLILFLVLLCCGISLSAQNYIETVHLKNGSIIHGVIVEQVPNESLKIKTQDGSLFVFQMNEISKITKDVLTNSAFKTSGIQTGYRGFVDLGYSFGVGDYNVDRLEFSTSHGYQFSPNFYLGVGAGLNYFHDGEVASVPLFANPRVDFSTGQISPFIDLKVGYTVSEYVEGFYLAPSVGVRFDIQNNKGINLSLGYTMQKAEAYYDYYDYNGYYSSYYGNVNIGAITLKLGLDF